MPRNPLEIQQSLFEGIGSGAERSVCGEVVFNTGMVGYVEALTDPSYAGQILVLTYSLIGNYGVPAPRPEASLAAPYESARIQLQGLVVQRYVDEYSHHAARRSLAQWLRGERIPAVTGIDTRTLKRRLRARGTMRGWLVPADQPPAEAKARAESIDMQREVFERVAPAEPIEYGGGDRTILLADAGAKDNLVRSLLALGDKVIRAPWHARLAPLAQRADGMPIRRAAVDAGVPLITDLQLARAVVEALRVTGPDDLRVLAWQDFVSRARRTDG